MYLSFGKNVNTLRSFQALTELNSIKFYTHVYYSC